MMGGSRIGALYFSRRGEAPRFDAGLPLTALPQAHLANTGSSVGGARPKPGGGRVSRGRLRLRSLAAVARQGPPHGLGVRPWQTPDSAVRGRGGGAVA